MKYTFANTTSTYYYPSPKSYIYKDGKPVWSGKVDLGNGTYVSPSLGTSLGYDGEKEYNKHTLAYNDDKNKINANFSLLDMKNPDIVVLVALLKRFPGMEQAVILHILEKPMYSISKRLGKILVNTIF